MILRILLGLIVLLNTCSDLQDESKPGLRIENGINRGVSYTDPQGITYSIRYIPITITNDNPTPIHIKIAFLKEYDYPTANHEGTFKVFPFPKEMSPDEVVHDSNSYELSKGVLHDFLDKGFDIPYSLNVTAKPGQKIDVAIGTLYPRPAKNSVLPNVLFTHSERDTFPECDWHMKEEPCSNPEIALGLKLNLCLGGPRVLDGKSYSPGCMIIPCGRVTYFAE